MSLKRFQALKAILSELQANLLCLTSRKGQRSNSRSSKVLGYHVSFCLLNTFLSSKSDIKGAKTHFTHV